MVTEAADRVIEAAGRASEAAERTPQTVVKPSAGMEEEGKKVLR